MKAEEQYLEYSQEPKSEELAIKLAILQKEAFQANDSDTYLKTTLLLHDTFVFLQSLEEAASVIQEAIRTNLIEDLKVLLSLSDKLVAILLKTEDFTALEAALKYRERFLANNPPQILMQKFYWSVCWEGLKKYPEAIAVLEGIGEGISNNNLVSKYLKLAMLQLKMKNLSDARQAFDHAVIFDKTRKNEMFHLVESDLLSAEGDFPAALKKYQEFFLKTKVKNRYLDRFIFINIGLNNLGEAWKFYQEYAGKLSGTTSKNYQYQLHQAGLQLAEKMGKFDEAAEIKEKMLSVYDTRPVILEAFDGVRTLFSLSQKKSVFQKERDIYLETFRELGSVLDLPGLYFIRPFEDGKRMYHYRKGLLLEKSLTSAMTDHTVIEQIWREHREYFLFTAEELSEFTEFCPDTRGNVPTACVQAFLVPINASNAGYLVTFLDKEVHFDYVNKMLFTTKAILETRLGYFDRLNSAKEETLAVKQLFAMDDRGLAKIIEGTMYLMNDKAKEILQAESDLMPFEAFQSRFQTENPLYLDRLIGKSCWSIPFLSFQNQTRQLEIRVHLENLTVFLSFRDVTDETARLRELQDKADKAALSSLGSLHRFLEDYQELRTQSALLSLRIGVDFLSGHGYSVTEIRNLSAVAHSTFRKAFGSHLIGGYLGEEGTALWLLSTTDKRVIDRAFSEGALETIRAWALPASDVPPLTGGAINLLKGKTIDENLEHLRKASASATEKIPLVYFDKEMAFAESRIEAATILLRPILETGTIALSYRQIGNLETRKVEYYRSRISADSLPADPDDLDAAVRILHAGSRLFLIRYRQMIKDMLECLSETNVEVPFAIPVSEDALMDPPAGEEWLRIPRKAKIPLGNIILIYHPSGDSIPPLIWDRLGFLKDKGMKIALEGISSLVTIVDFTRMKGFDFLNLSFSESAKIPSEILEWASGPAGLRIIVRDVDDEETARSLTQRRLPRIEGNVLPSDLSPSALRKIMKKH